MEIFHFYVAMCAAITFEAKIPFCVFVFVPDVSTAITLLAYHFTGQFFVFTKWVVA